MNNRLGFDTHVTNICNRVNKKFHALARILFMNIHKRRMTTKAFIVSKFGYCPLVWMFHSRKLNGRVNKLHERALRIVQIMHLHLLNSSTTINNRNIQLLASELFKVNNGLSPPFMNEIFVESAHHYYNLRKKLTLREIMLKRCTTELKL